MADYYDMKDKMRRSAQDERAARFRATSGNDPYAAEIIAAESRVAAPPRAAAPSAPQATVRGVPEGMTAEYYAPRKPEAEAPPQKMPAEDTPLYQAVRRIKKAHNELARLDDERKAYAAAGAGIGGAIGAGLTAATGPFVVPGTMFGSGLGANAGYAGRGFMDQPLFRAAHEERKAAERAAAEALRSKAFSQQELDEALAAQNLVWKR
jgi:hypothetical protein